MFFSFQTLRQLIIYRYSIQRLQKIIDKVDEICKTRKHFWERSLDYSPDDVQYLLHLVTDVAFLGRNHYAVVVKTFEQWLETKESLPITLHNLKDKVDKLEYTKRETGDPTIKPNLRPTKQIYHDIQVQGQAMALCNNKKNRCTFRVTEAASRKYDKTVGPKKEEKNVEWLSPSISQSYSSWDCKLYRTPDYRNDKGCQFCEARGS